MRICIIPGCGGKHVGNGFCGLHWRRNNVHGDPLKAIKPKKKEGETVLDCTGYLRGPGNVHVHRQAAEKMLGRPLNPGEVVHHIDGNRTNNDASNLIVFPSNADHSRHHAQLRKAARMKA